MKRLLAVLLSAFLAATCSAVEQHVASGGLSLTTDNETTLADAAFVSVAESQGFFFLCSVKVLNQSSQATQLTLALKETGAAFATHTLTTSVPAGITLTYQIPLTLSGLAAGSYTLRCTATADSPGVFAVSDDSFAGVFSDAGASPGAIVSLGAAGTPQTGAAQTFATSGLATGDCDGTSFCIDSTANVHTWVLPNASTSHAGTVSTGTQSFNGLKIFIQSVSSPDSGTNSERFGTGTQADGDSSVALGATAFVGAGGDQGIALGFGASVQGANSIAIGWLSDDNSNAGCVLAGREAECTGALGTAIGNLTSAAAAGVTLGDESSAATNAVCLGAGATCVTQYGVGVGYAAAPLSGICLGAACGAAAHAFVAGSSTQTITDVYFGEGITDGTPSTATIHATGGSGSNIGGPDLNLYGGAGTGSAAGGNVGLGGCPAGSSGTTLNTCAVQWKLAGNTGVFQPASDDTYDLGTSGTRPANGYFRRLWAAKEFGLEPSAIQVIGADNTAITVTASKARIQLDTSRTLTSAPTVADGTRDGQILWIVNVDSADTLTLSDQGTLASSNLRLSANTVAIGPRDSLCLEWDTTVGDWLQCGLNNVL